MAYFWLPRFSLRALFVLITLCGIAMSWVAHIRSQSVAREKEVQFICKHLELIEGGGVEHVRLRPEVSSAFNTWLGAPYRDREITHIWCSTLPQKWNAADHASQKKFWELVLRQPKLEFLNLPSPILHGYGEVVGQLPALDTLHLQGDGATDEDLSAIVQLSALRAFTMDGSWLTDQALERLGKCPNLHWIRVRRANITPEGLQHLTQLQHLDDLEVDETPLGDAAVPVLLQCKGLRNLELDQTQLSDAGLMQLAEHPRLNSLDAKETFVTSAGVQAFENRMRELINTGTRVQPIILSHSWPALKVNADEKLEEGVPESAVPEAAP